MNLAVVFSRTNDGIDAPLVTVEVHLSNGLPGFAIVGLPEMAVKESKDRVRAAIINSRFEFPAKRITVNLAPADLPKDGGRFDLPIALGILAASGGQLRPVKGVLPTAYAASEANRKLFLPSENANEASLIKELEVYPAKIAAAGNHNLLMIGPPGTGKTMLASRLATILPPMSEKESLESAAIASISDQGFESSQWGLRPIRDPHHTSSGVALVGGGAKVRPGEISLAHNGVLFLDELVEFDRKVLDVLREPLETGNITISRAARQASYPARFQLIAAMNPCPQGRDCDFKSNCHCSLEQQRKHRSRLSAPFLDRIDLQIEVLRLPREGPSEPSNRRY
ncbi:Competence protein ComM [Nymphon striatum]|nr:Competence protein ComM [Nymphon striatum]